MIIIIYIFIQNSFVIKSADRG